MKIREGYYILNRVLFPALLLATLLHSLAGVLVLDGTLLILLSVFTALLVIIKHIPALYRISKGQEEKFRIVEDISYKLEE